MWISTIPVLSTAHVPNAEALPSLQGLTRTAEYDEGAFVWIGLAQSPQDDMPEWLLPIIAWWHSAHPDETWLRFDRDGDVVDTLPTYDW